VIPDLTSLTSQITLTPYQAIGIPIAVVGAVFLALGAQLQHRGVVQVDAVTEYSAKGGLSLNQLVQLLRSRAWVVGTLMLGLAIVFQLTSLTFAPLIVVQPLGAVALVVTAVVNSRVSKVKLGQKSKRAIAMCVGGIAVFVTTAAFTAKSRPIQEYELVTVLVILGAVLVVFGLLFFFLHNRFKAIFYIIGAGVLYGFVATLAKVVIDRIKTLILVNFNTGGIEWLTISCVAALLVAALLGSYFVQTAYSSGPPDLVVAGLTVIDPLVAVSVGIIVLGEAASAPLWAVFVFILAAASAIYGVLQLSRSHPQSQH
jgi:drug/metabolite transporter (DMT)-like permease